MQGAEVIAVVRVHTHSYSVLLCVTLNPCLGDDNDSSLQLVQKLLSQKPAMHLPHPAKQPALLETARAYQHLPLTAAPHRHAASRRGLQHTAAIKTPHGPVPEAPQTALPLH